MSQPNLHHLRKFIDRAESLKGEGQTVLTHSEIRSVALTLGALLIYHKQLEQEIRELKATNEENALEVELVGDRF